MDPTAVMNFAARVGVATAMVVLTAATARAEIEPQRELEAAVPSAAIEGDPGAGRGWLTPTALVQPAGSTTISNDMGLLMSVTHGVADGAEASGYLMVPGIVSDTMYVMIGGGGKIGLRDHGRVRAAIAARAAAMFGEYTTWWAAQATAVATVCVRAACDQQVSVSTSLLGMTITGSEDDGGGSSEVGVAAAVSWTQPVWTGIKVIAEAGAGVNADGTPVSGGAAGLRLHGRHWMVQGMAALVGEGRSFEVAPWLNAGLRW